MRVLVTGGTGVIGHGLIPALQRGGHQVRLLTRHAKRDAEAWEGVEPWEADVTDTARLRHAAKECGAVVHVAGIAHESPPELTFERVNVDGTRRLVSEAQRAGVPHFVFISSLGANRGRSAYQRSKLEGEQWVRGFRGRWIILRSGNVYGPGDSIVSLLIQMVRALPIVPVVGGHKRFQPIWCEDLGAAIAQALEREDLAGRTLDVAGGEVTTVDDLLERLERVTSRKLRRVHLPKAMASLGVRLAEGLSLDQTFARLVGLELPIDTSRLTMLEEENIIRAGGVNALVDVFRITPTPLDEGLRRLALEMPEQLPEDGVGPLQRKRFWAVIRGSGYSAPELMQVFRNEARELLPVTFVGEGGSPDTASRPIEANQTLTFHLPARGEVQVRVEEANDERVTLATIAGHPLAGAVTFSAEPAGADVRFQIEVLARSANLLDLVAMMSGGEAMQRSAWENAVANVIERSGGATDRIEHTKEVLEQDRARAAERWIARVVKRRQRRENAART